ncbi:MAG: topology modulation protein [Bacilli bacterium]|nr:topology modulation protein [Bacilli bacterium]
MKIQVCGFSASGKSTFSKALSSYYNTPVLHLDTIHFGPNWEIIPDSVMDEKIKEFLKNNDSWVIDGNYKNAAPVRFEECDLLFYFDFNRFTCIYNAYKRYRKYRNVVRDDMAAGCDETLDFEFITWILFRSRIRRRKKYFKELGRKYKDKFVVFKNHKQVDKYLENLIKK